jgi:copper chaperone CopZ
VTFLLLGTAFYFTYRSSKAPAAVAADAADSCCPPENTRGIGRKKVNKAIRWAVTVFVLAFALFPNYVGYLLGGDGTLAARDDLDKVAVQIDGMTCEACAAGIEDAIRKVPGVAAAEVTYEKRQAVVGYPRGARISPQAILDAIDAAGPYTGSFLTRDGADVEDH